jgi:hypothetical protein
MTEKEEYLVLVNNPYISMRRSVLVYTSVLLEKYFVDFFSSHFLEELKAKECSCCVCKQTTIQSIRLSLPDKLPEGEDHYNWQNCSTGDCTKHGMAVLCNNCLEKGEDPKYMLGRREDRGKFHLIKRL